MSNTTYVDYTTPTVNASWLNEINDHVWHDTPVAGTTIHSATKIAVTPFDDIAATDVQAALNEINDKITSSELRKSFSITDFDGVDPSGLTDSYAGITAALAALGDADEIIMNGTFATSATINFTKRRCSIVGNPTVIPFGGFSDYLWHFNGAGSDPLVPDLAQKTNVSKITFDGKLQSRGVKFTQLYNAALFDISVFRAYGTSVKFEACMEDSFHGMLISGGKQRAASWLGTQTVWNAGIAYTTGQIVRIDYPAAVAATAYNAGDFVTSGGEAWRARVNTTGATLTGTNSDFWEWMPFEYFKCLLPNTGKYPHSASPLYTNRSTIPSNKYWQQVFPYEAALDIEYVDSPYSNNNLSFYGLWVRHCDNVPLVRIDSNNSAFSITDINFFGGQVHQILPEYITAYDAQYPSAPCGQVVPSRGVLLEIGSSFDVNIFGGNWRVGEADNCKAVQIGWKNPGKTLRDVGFYGVSFNGDGDNLIAISSMPSYDGTGFKCAETVFRMIGTNCSDTVDPYGALRHKSRLGVNYNGGRVIINENANPSITIGRAGEAGSPSIPMISSGLSLYDARVSVTGGTAEAGNGIYLIEAQGVKSTGYISPGAYQSISTATSGIMSNAAYIDCVYSEGTTTLTLPNPVLYANRMLVIKNIFNQLVVSASDNVQPKLGGAAGTAILPAVAGSQATLISDGVVWRTIST